MQPARTFVRGIPALLLAVVTPAASASSVARLDLELLSARADHIVVGHVEKMESHFLAPGSQRIVTDVTLVTEQNVLGDAASRFVVRRLGGEVGHVGQIVHGEASYAVGERVVLFAAKRQDAFFSVGMAQGVLHVYEDAAGVSRVRTVALEPSRRRMLPEGRPVADLVDEVRALVARKGTK